MPQNTRNTKRLFALQGLLRAFVPRWRALCSSVLVGTVLKHRSLGAWFGQFGVKFFIWLSPRPGDGNVLRI